MNVQMDERSFRFLLFAMLIGFAGAGLILWASLETQTEIGLQSLSETSMAVPRAKPQGGPASAGDLGAGLYEKSQNPLAGELPDAVATVPNPLEGAYQNPFE